jgi:hypothetical protein
MSQFNKQTQCYSDIKIRQRHYDNLQITISHEIKLKSHHEIEQKKSSNVFAYGSSPSAIYCLRLI